MKKIFFILIIILVALFDGKAGSAEIHTNQEIKQGVIKTDSVLVDDSTDPIRKTVVIEEETEPNSRNNLITIALAALAIVLVFIFRMIRKKRKLKKPEKY